MDIFEEAVLAYISATPGRFVKHQYSLAYRDGVGGSCPDFVVIDYIKETIYVVEVTARSNPSNVLSRVRERETRWFTPLKKEMSQWSESFAYWRYRVTLFVRGDVSMSLIKEINKDMNDVSVKLINDVIFPWSWVWNDQQVENSLE